MEKKMKILVVDDEDIVVKAPSRTLQKDNYEWNTPIPGKPHLS